MASESTSSIFAPQMVQRATAVAGGRRLSVCHIVSGDTWAGAEVQVATLLRALSRRGDLRVSAIVLNQGRLAEELRRSGIVVKIIPETRFGFGEVLQIAREFLAERGAQVVHSHRYKENLLAVLAARMGRVPVQVRTVHGMREPFRGWDGIRQSLLHMVDRWSGRLAADAIIAVSEGMTPRLAEMYGQRKIATIRNGIETAQVQSPLNKASARARFKLSDAPVIGIVGRLVPVKRIDLFLCMAEQVRRERPDAQFVIAGDGPERVERMEQVRAVGWTRNVRFLGHRDDIYDVLRALDVLVMCSDHEGMPMTLLEAQWLGVPVVGRRVPGIREVLCDGRNGLCVEGDDPHALAGACLRLLGDPALGRALCETAAREIDANYSAGHNAELVAALYQRLAAEARR
ncbi:MAG: glycosyltransferase [Acidobacteriota bacterium]|nr:glycosyltransferase [Acidobacteriota bacterium]